MIAVQMPPSQPTLHRRHPSAPIGVLVKPTHIPGLLHISKRQVRQQVQRSHPRAQTHGRAPVSAKQLPSQAPAVQSDTPTLIPVQNTDRHARGRHPPKEKKQPRSISPSQSTRRGARQASPVSPSQVVVEGVRKAGQNDLNKNISGRTDAVPVNLADPFVDLNPERSLVSSNAFTVRPPPSIASKPNGTLAYRRKNRKPPSSPTPIIAKPAHTPVPAASRAVPDPQTFNFNSPAPSNLSRSVPIFSHIPAAQAIKRSSTPTWDEFPICDDTTDLGEDDATPASPPSRLRRGHKSMPLGPHAYIYDQPLRTAPLLSAPWSMEMQQTPPSHRRHQRAPSDGVFIFEEEPSHFMESPERLNAEHVKKPFFANALFQNSPSPDELPPLGAFA